MAGWAARSRRPTRRDPASSPYSACSAQAHGWVSPSAVARCPAARSGACRNQDSEPQGRGGIRREGVAKRRGALRWPFVTKYALVPSLAHQPISLLGRFLGALQKPDRSAVNAFARLGAHRSKMAFGASIGNSYQLRWIIASVLVAAGCHNARSAR
jgi:hypothetical protein